MSKSAYDFSVLHKSKKSQARCGKITTPHGVIETPALVTVGTKGTVKSLDPKDIEQTSTQCIFVNAYHMVVSTGTGLIKKAGGIHVFSGINKPIITDSGGFQVFSLARRGTKVLTEKIKEEREDIQSPTLVKITDDGVEFRSHIDGETFFFSPEFSINAQVEIGADFIVSFDENIYYGATKKYTQRSLERTQDWAKRSLEALNTNAASMQKMYGVIQGGMYKDLHLSSTRKISALPFWGLAIGGVSVGMTKAEIRENVSWTIDIIQDDPRPRHLLGIGHFDDIVDMVKMGVDTFDCVVPTRDARVGKLYIGNSLIDILEMKFKNDLSPIDTQCPCYTCLHFTRAYLHHLFKQKELLAYRLSTIHNLFSMEQFFRKIREEIERDKL